MSNRKQKFHSYLKTVLWVIAVQLLLFNISAALYAYKFTHLYEGPVQPHSDANFLVKTWKLFSGPNIYKMPPLGKPAFAYEEIVLKTPGGIAIQAWYSREKNAQGCVIFFHGITGNKTGMLLEASRFKAWGYSILLVDLRGHGKSEGLTSFGVTETEEVKEAFDFVVSKGERKVILYGASMGAAIVLKAVADNKVHPAAIITDMSFASLHDHLKARARVEGFPSEPFAFFVTLWIGIEKGYNGFNHRVDDYAKKVKCPVLLQWGDRDRYVTKEETDKIYRSLQTVHKKLVIYPDADHESLLTADQIRWDQEVKAFVGSY